MGDVFEGALRRDGFDRFHDRGSLDQGRPDNVLFALCDGAEDTPRQLCRLRHQAERRVDEDDCSRVDQLGGRLSK